MLPAIDYSTRARFHANYDGGGSNPFEEGRRPSRR